MPQKKQENELDLETQLEKRTGAANNIGESRPSLRSATLFDVLGQSASPLGHFHDGSSLIASMGGFALCYLLSEEAMTCPSGHNAEEPSVSLVVREIAISLHLLNTVWPG